MKFLKIIKIHNFHPRFILSIVKSIIFLKNIKKNLLPRNEKSDTKTINQFLSFINKNLTLKKNSSDQIILMDCANIPNYLISNLILTSELKKILKCNISTFDYDNRIGVVEKMMKTINAGHLKISLNSIENLKQESYFLDCIKKLKNKNDLHNLKLKQISIGVDIYETILKEGNPTINFGTIEMYLNIYKGILYFVFFENLFKKKLISALCLSDNTYINTGIPIKIAYKYSIPVFHANPIEINRTENEYQLHSRFNRYKEYFSALTRKKKNKYLKDSKKLLMKKISGQTKIKIHYQEKSAFTKKIIKRQLNDNDKKKIIVATHCFFDNPNAYGNFLFKDFYDWLIFVGNIGEKLKKNYEIYIKPHRDYLPGTIEALNEIKQKFSNLEIIDPETSFYQLKKEGASIVLTGYGSVGHELPLLNFKVINAGFNPHYNYSFNLHPKDIKKYGLILSKLEKQKNKINRKEIYEFFYTHYTLNRSDDFLFDSYEKYCRYVKYKMKNENCYKYFLKNDKIFLRKYRKNIYDSIISNRCFSVEKILKKEKQIKLKKTDLSKFIKYEII